jgi:RNA polymerase sigma-70 factor, ECF subfamily
VDNSEPSDETLCERVAAGDERAFDQLVERYQARAYRTAWLILRDADEARDLSQEAFVRLYQAAGRFRGEARFSTWFHRILVNLCLDHRRKWRFWRQHAAPAEEIDLVATPEAHPVDLIARAQTSRALWDAVGRLSPKQRAVLVLLVQEGLETAEIAAALRVSEATVRVHLHRAVTALRKRFGPGGSGR